MLSCNWIFISRIKSTALCPRSIADAFCQRVRVRQWVMQLLNLNKYSLAWRWRIGRTRTVWHDVQSVQFHKSTSKIGFQMLRLLAWHGRYLQPNFSWWHKFMRLDVVLFMLCVCVMQTYRRWPLFLRTQKVERHTLLRCKFRLKHNLCVCFVNVKHCPISCQMH